MVSLDVLELAVKSSERVRRRLRLLPSRIVFAGGLVRRLGVDQVLQRLAVGEHGHGQQLLQGLDLEVAALRELGRRRCLGLGGVELLQGRANSGCNKNLSHEFDRMHLRRNRWFLLREHVKLAEELGASPRGQGSE